MRKLIWKFTKFRLTGRAFYETHENTFRQLFIIFVLSCLTMLALLPFNVYFVQGSFQQFLIPEGEDQIAIDPATIQPPFASPESVFLYYQERFLEWPIILITILIVVSVVTLLYKGGLPLIQAIATIIRGK